MKALPYFIYSSIVAAWQFPMNYQHTVYLYCPDIAKHTEA